MTTNHNFKVFVLLVFLVFCTVGVSAQTIYAEQHKVFSGINKIEVRGSFCDVEIVGNESDQVKFDGLIKGELKRFKKFEIKYETEGDLLSVWVDSPNSFNGRLEASLRFSVPSDIQLMVKNSSGDIYCQGLIGKAIALQASSGDIEAKKFKANVDINTSSGEISVKNIIGNANLISTSGDHEISDVVGNIVSKTSSGDVEFKFIEGDISSKTTSGTVEIHNLVGRLKHVSSSGSIEVNDSKVYLDLTATSGDIQGNNVLLVGESFFNTTSGDIDLHLRNDSDQLSFDLVASSGSLKAGNRKGDKKLYLQNGKVWVHGKSSSGDQTYY